MSNKYTLNPARPVLAAEVNDTTQTYKPGNDKQSPRYALLPSGLDANRVRFSGKLEDVDEVADGYYCGELVGPTGTIYVYAGDNSPGPRACLMNAEGSPYITVKGKIKPFEGNDGEIRVKIAPETMTPVPADERHRTIADAATNLVHRLKHLLEMGETSGRFSPDIYKDHYGDDHFEGLEYLDDAITALEDVHNAAGPETADLVQDNEPSVSRAD